MITNSSKKKIQQIINVFETGSIDGKYGTISKYKDGPNGIKQITYGRSQTTEFGNLKRLVELYIQKGGTNAAGLVKYVSKIGKQPSLVTDEIFISLLKDSGNNDPIMKECQDEFFDSYYYHPALIWFEGYGFKEPLSLLVIYDSFIHSGGVKDYLRQRFPERPPKFGGDEKKWIAQYVDVRHLWLKNHKRKILNGTIYRTQCFKNQIKNDNWDLKSPVIANGLKVE